MQAESAQVGVGGPGQSAEQKEGKATVVRPKGGRAPVADAGVAQTEETRLNGHSSGPTVGSRPDQLQHLTY